MRTLLSLVVALAALGAIVGCRDEPSRMARPEVAAEPEATPVPVASADCSWIGERVQQVMVHQAPKSSSGPLTVWTTPSIPAFSPSDDATGLKFVAQPGGAARRWAKVAVANFRNLDTGGPMEPQPDPQGPCGELTGPNAPDENKCRVVFPASAGTCWLFKYDILLFADAGDDEPDLILDPVGIIR